MRGAVLADDEALAGRDDASPLRPAICGIALHPLRMTAASGTSIAQRFGLMLRSDGALVIYVRWSMAWL